MEVYIYYEAVYRLDSLLLCPFDQTLGQNRMRLLGSCDRLVDHLPISPNSVVH
jgi:hypothetical protein